MHQIRISATYTSSVMLKPEKLESHKKVKSVNETKKQTEQYMY
jgi:hypothetical protein